MQSDLTTYVQSARKLGMKPHEIAGALLNAGWKMDDLVQVLLTLTDDLEKPVAVRPIIEVRDIEKSFGKTHALRGVTMDVVPGTITALLGPNGAGKTTLVRILTTLMTPDKGAALVAGYDLSRDPQAIRTLIGLTGQYAAVDDRLTGRENLEMVGRLYHLSAAQAKARAQELLAQFQLTDAADRPLKTYSGGMRRRLDLAASLVNRPQILFLDEPTTGLDPQNRLTLWKVVKDLAASGTTIVLTTQYLEEADQLAEQIIVMDKGRIIAQGSADHLKSQTGGDVIEIHLAHREQHETALSLLEGSHAGETEGMIRMPTQQGARGLVSVIRVLDGANISVADIALRRPTLDEVFLSLTNA